MTLALAAIDVSIEASVILRNVTLDVAAGEVVCLVGRNGAGKTSTLRTIMGYLRPRAGTITFKGEPIAGRPTYEIAARGIGYAPEESAIFADLTVAENVEIATWTRPVTARTAAERIDLAYEVFPTLRAYAARGGTQLSGGERKMLSIARALALDPDLFLLDEPFEGLSPAIIPALHASIAAIARLGPGMLVAESNIHHVPDFARRLYVIERGEIIFSGTPEQAHADPAVMRIIGGKAT
jgi:branched-chain amino acid transport system ATP-binding protein